MLATRIIVFSASPWYPWFAPIRHGGVKDGVDEQTIDACTNGFHCRNVLHVITQADRGAALRRMVRPGLDPYYLVVKSTQKRGLLTLAQQQHEVMIEN